MNMSDETLEILGGFDVELPVDGSQDQFFLDLGIEFGPFEDGDKLRLAKLPPGWTLQYSDEAKHSFIVNQDSVARAYVYLKNGPHMRPINRFSISVNKSEDIIRIDIHDALVKFGERRKSILHKEYTLPDRQRHLDVYNTRAKQYEEETRAEFEEWLKEKYPNWQNDLAYWDEREEEND